MRIDVLTLFPEMFEGPLTSSILQRASSVAPPFRGKSGVMEDRQENKPLHIFLHDPRKWGLGKHKQVDDTPYGGGAGMILRVDVVVPAIEAVMRKGTEGTATTSPYRIYLSPRGRRLTQAKVEQLAKKHWLLLLAGHYEGIDERVIEGGWIDEELSIGDYVLTGGELPAMVLIDAVARQIPGVLGKEESAFEESFSKKLGRKREYPHYTKPEKFQGLQVPSMLLSGNHREIAKWRRERLQ